MANERIGIVEDDDVTATHLPREMNQILQATLDHTHILVAYLDPQFNFVRVNRAYAESSEREPSFYPGKNYFDLHPDAKNQDIFQDAMKTGKSYAAYATPSQDCTPFECTQDPKRGTSYWDWSLVPIKDAENIATGVVLTLVNVTERVRAQEGHRQALAETVQATHALRESEERYREIAESITDVFFAMDTELTYTYWNKASEDLARISAQDTIGKSLFDIFPDTPKAIEKIYREVLTTRQPQSFVSEYLLGEQDIPFEISVYPTQSGISVFARDITERRQADEVLYESEKRYRDLYENAPNAYFSVGVDGCIRRCNKRAKDLLGYAVEELMGYPMLELYADVPEGKEKALQIFQRFRDGETVIDEEFQMRRADGTLVWVSSIINAVHDTRGQVVGSRSMVVDITERKQAEEALRQRNHELALLNQASQVFSSTLDLDQVLIIVLEEARRLMDVVACSIWLTDPETGELVCQQATGWQNESVRGWRLAPREGIAGWTVYNNKSAIVPDTWTDERYYQNVDQHTGLLLRSILSIPLRVKENVIGVLQAVDTKINCFDAADLASLELLATPAAIAIENARLYKQAQREIVERRRVEEALRESKELFEKIFTSQLDAIFLLDEKSPPTITDCNTAAAEIFGYTRQEMMGRTTAFLHVDEVVLKEFQEYLYTAIKEHGFLQLADFRMKSKDGTIFPTEHSVVPIEDEQGHCTGWISVVRDIAERKQAEEALRHRNQELTALNAIATTINQSPNLDHILNATLYRVLQVIEIDVGWIQLLDKNTGTLSLAVHHGFSQEMVNKTKRTRLGEGLTGKVAQSGQPIVMDNVSDDPWLSIEINKQKTLYAFAGVPIKSKDRVLGVMGVFSHSPREISSPIVQLLTAIGHQIGIAIENVQLNEEASEIEILQELDRLRSELIANVSHELRTPLGLIKIFCTTLLRKDVEFDRETQHEFLCDIDAETGKLERIVDNLLDLSRMESGRLRLEKQPMDVVQLAQNVVKAMQMDIQPIQHSLVHDFSSAPLMATADAKYIEQVLRNLLGNAIKYSPAGGTITVGGRDNEMQLLLWVSDHGIGIPAQDLSRVFERFYRVENELTRNVRGAGLGLAVCRGIIEAHGGRIWVESKLDVGSTFYFTLMRETMIEETGND
ncbi:MAG: PAS domain S-box protein [Chloroflexi bacterium]|nr:PAS domain S-box protein [Chloroflexota bacterium]